METVGTAYFVREVQVVVPRSATTAAAIYNNGVFECFIEPVCVAAEMLRYLEPCRAAREQLG